MDELKVHRPIRPDERRTASREVNPYGDNYRYSPAIEPITKPSGSKAVISGPMKTCK